MTAPKACCCRALSIACICAAIVSGILLVCVSVIALRVSNERRERDEEHEPAPVAERRLSNAEVERLRDVPPPCGYRSWYEYAAVKHESQ